MTEKEKPNYLDENLSERAEILGKEMMEELKAINSPLVKEVRGMGLLVGVEINPEIASAREVCEMLLKHGVLSKDTHQTVVRFAPPLTMTAEELSDAMKRVRAAVNELDQPR